MVESPVRFRPIRVCRTEKVTTWDLWSERKPRRVLCSRTWVRVYDDNLVVETVVNRRMGTRSNTEDKGRTGPRY